MSIAVYGNRVAPRTTIHQVEVLKELFTRKTVVTVDDIHKATGKKWIRGFMNALDKTVEHVVPVKDGRNVIGYRFESKQPEVSSTGSIKINGRFVKLASAAKKAAPAKKAKATTETETTTETPAKPKRVRAAKKVKGSAPEVPTVEATPNVPTPTEAPVLDPALADILS